MKPLIASILYCLGFKYSVSTFIDGVTLTYGYGRLDSLGSWEYEIEARWILRRISK